MTTGIVLVVLGVIVALVALMRLDLSRPLGRSARDARLDAEEAVRRMEREVLEALTVADVEWLQARGWEPPLDVARRVARTRRIETAQRQAEEAAAVRPADVVDRHVYEIQTAESYAPVARYEQLVTRDGRVHVRRVPVI